MPVRQRRFDAGPRVRRRGKRALTNITPIFVVDEDSDLRNALVATFRSEGRRARGFSCRSAFRTTLPADRTACVILDIGAGDEEGAELIAHLIKARGKIWPVIVITGFADVPMVVTLMKAGVADIIEKPVDAARILSAVQTCMGTIRVNEGLWDETVKVRQRVQLLTPRERQVFDLLMVGRTNKEIASDLEISPRTVEIFRAQVMQKMGAESFSALIRAGSQIS
jgi:two-component system response regulator FixJ